MTTSKLVREVRLPDGRVAVEVRTELEGEDETCYSHDYFLAGARLARHGMETNYWGRIEGAVVRRAYLVDELAARLSRELSAREVRP